MSDRYSKLLCLFRTMVIRQGSVHYMALAHVVRTVIAVTITAFLLAGCASTGQISELETTHYTERLQTRTDGGMQVSTSVLSDAEAAAVYGVPLADKGIQPVWIRHPRQPTSLPGPVPVPTGY